MHATIEYYEHRIAELEAENAQLREFIAQNPNTSKE